LHFSCCDAFVILVVVVGCFFRFAIPSVPSLSAAAAIDRSTVHDDGQHRQPPQQQRVRAATATGWHKEKRRGNNPIS
jgi:hypothetical protein